MSSLLLPPSNYHSLQKSLIVKGNKIVMAKPNNLFRRQPCLNEGSNGKDFLKFVEAVSVQGVASTLGLDASFRRQRRRWCRRRRTHLWTI